MDSTQLTLIALVIAFILASIFFFAKRVASRKINQLLLTKQFDLFDQKINAMSSKILFSKVTLLNYQLTKAFLNNEKKKINELFETLNNISQPLKKRKNLYMQAFNYYVSSEDKPRSKAYLEKIESLKDPQFSLEANITYDVYINKGDKYLDTLLKKISENDEIYNGIDEFLISKIYENKHDKTKAEYYLAQAKEHLQAMDKLIASQKKS